MIDGATRPVGPYFLKIQSDNVSQQENDIKQPQSVSKLGIISDCLRYDDHGKVLNETFGLRNYLPEGPP